MSWDPQRLAYTGRDRPITQLGPGDRWGSPEDDDPPRCYYAKACYSKGLTCLGLVCPWWEWDDFPPPFEPSEP